MHSEDKPTTTTSTTTTSTTTTSTSAANATTNPTEMSLAEVVQSSKSGLTVEQLSAMEALQDAKNDSQIGLPNTSVGILSEPQTTAQQQSAPEPSTQLSTQPSTQLSTEPSTQLSTKSTNQSSTDSSPKVKKIPPNIKHNNQN